MALNNSVIIIIAVVAFAFYLIWSHNRQPKYVAYNTQGANVGYSAQPQMQVARQPTFQYQAPMEEPKRQVQAPIEKFIENGDQQMTPRQRPVEQSITKINIEAPDTDPYSDPIKKQDLYTMYDPLTYPQMRLPREVLEKYNEYRDRTGAYPAFNQATQPMFDNPILNGILIKQVDEDEPFVDNTPSTVPLFRVKSAKNNNRYFYYILDQRYLSKLELKIPLDQVRINGQKQSGADFYGLPEIFDGDIIENIPIYPNEKFKVTLYKQYHWP